MLTQTAREIKASLNDVSTSVGDAWEATQNKAAKLWSDYKNPETWTDWTAAKNKYSADLQVGSVDNYNFEQKFKNAFPDKLRREAVINYMGAKGDMNLLRERADASTKYKPGYEMALKLTPEEQEQARNFRTYFDQMFDKAQDNGMLSHGVENYITGIWERKPNNSAAEGLRAAAAYHELNPNPDFLKKKIWDTYFDGEQAGAAPKDKDIGFIVSTYNNAFNSAVAARTFIKSLHEGKASDGRPLTDYAGGGDRIDADPAAVTYFVKPKIKPKDAKDYVTVDHPALRNWKWVTSDDVGQPVFLRADMLVHPEAVKELQNILGSSALRKVPILNAALKVSTEVKGVILSFSPFHPVQIGIHAVEHTTNPIMLPKLDVNDPVQRSLIEHGLVVAEHHGEAKYSEGLAGSGIIAHIPIIGGRAVRSQDLIFKVYIPRIKMAMATHALERNRARYGKDLSDDQIQHLTAQQANAAFGHLNYIDLARNKTAQDIFRLVALAPDFLEARGRFVAQAAKPYGREQQRALILGAVGLVVSKFVIGQLAHEEQDWSLKHVFLTKIGGREYGPRTLQGDVIHLITDPLNFWSNRLNPAIAKPALGLLFGNRDASGRKRTAGQALYDYMTTPVPIPFKGLVPGSYQDLPSTLLQSVGIQSKKYRSAAQDVLQDYYNDNPGKAPTEHSKALKAILEAARSGDTSKAWKLGREGIAAKTMAPKDVTRMMTLARMDPLEASLKNSEIPAEVALKAYDKATPKERLKIAHVVQAKARASVQKPWEWTDEMRSLAQKHFKMNIPKAGATPPPMAGAIPGLENSVDFATPKPVY